MRGWQASGGARAPRLLCSTHDGDVRLGSDNLLRCCDGGIALVPARKWPACCLMRAATPAAGGVVRTASHPPFLSGTQLSGTHCWSPMERETLRLPFTRPLAVTQPPYTPGESAPKISELARHGTAAPTVGLSTNRRKTSRRKLEGGHRCLDARELLWAGRLVIGLPSTIQPQQRCHASSGT
jgi:hypothetical protein